MQEKTLRTIGATVILAGIAVAGIAQVGSDTGPSEIAAPDPTGTTVATAAPGSETPTTQPEPFVYRVGVLAGISTDNFWAFYGAEPSTWNSYILGPTKAALFSVDHSAGSIEPELAESAVEPKEGPNGWNVVVELDRQMSWSDGTPITAHDFVFTFQTVRDLGLGGSWADAFPAIVESVHADEDHILRIEFTERPNLSVWPHGIGLAPVMPQHVWAGHTEEATAETLYALAGDDDVSGGPLTLVGASDALVVSNSNPGYAGNRVPDVVEYHVYGSETEAIAALADGDIDSVLSPKGLTQDHIAQIEADPGVSLVDSPAHGVRYLGFNLQRDPMSDQAFRTALALMLEKDHLAEAVPGTAAPAWALVPEANAQWYDIEAASANAARYRGDLAPRLTAALDGLKAAGYAWATEPAVAEDGTIAAGTGLTVDGRPPQPLTILTPGDAYDPARPAYVQEIADTLALLGFDARPVETDFDTVVDLAFTPDEAGVLHYDMYLLGWTLGNPALPGYYRPLFAEGGPLNNSGYASEAFASALGAYEQAFTTDEARAALWQMETILATDLPYLLLYTSQITEAYRSDRVAFSVEEGLGGLQARLGGIEDVKLID